MTRIKNTGILYTSKKVPKFQKGGYYKNLFQDQLDMYPQTPNLGQPMGATGYMKATTPVSAFTGKSAFTSPMKASNFTPKADSFAKTAGNITKNVGANIDSSALNTPSLVSKNSGTGTTGPGVDMAAQAVNMGAEALDNIDDKDAATYSSKEKTGDISSSILKGAATGTSLATGIGAATGVAGVTAGATGLIPGILGSMGAFGALGSTVPIVGTVAGIVIGGIIGAMKAKKGKKSAEKVQTAQGKAIATKEQQQKVQELGKQDNLLRSAPVPTGNQYSTQEDYPGYNNLFRRKHGGTFGRITIPKSSDESPLKKQKPLLIAR